MLARELQCGPARLAAVGLGAGWVTMHKTRTVLIFCLLAVVTPTLWQGCVPQGGGKYGSLGATCPQLSGGGDPMRAQFGAAGEAEVTVRAFVAAAKDLAEVSAQMHAEVLGACQQIGADIGVEPSQLQASSVDQVCGATSARMDAILAAGGRLQVTATPPECSAQVDAQAECSAACEVELDPGEIVARCDPGKLSGRCEGRCQGRCEGTCRGQCDGQCQAVNASGQCEGHCDGTCHGQCDATCHARCEGEWVAPKCEGYVRPPSARGDCNAACDARASIRAECTPAKVDIAADAGAQDLATLAASLKTHLPTLVRAQFRLTKKLASSAKVLVKVGADLPEAVGKASLQAGACIAASVAAVAQANARINVSIQASASVTGKAGVSV